MKRSGIASALLGASLIAIVMILVFVVFGSRQSLPTVTSLSSAATATPTRRSNPTPWPTDTPPRVSPTPVPTQLGPSVEPTRLIPEVPTPAPGTPFHLTVSGERAANTKLSTQQAAIIGIGTVKQVMPARWTTPNGQRPANPFAPTNQETIFRPVLFEVDQYLKGQQPQRELLLFAFGGTVGQDTTERISDDLFVFHEGDKAILFLVTRGRSLNGSPMWDILEHYTITPDGQAVNTVRHVALQQLIDEVRDALSR